MSTFDVMEARDAEARGTADRADQIAPGVNNRRRVLGAASARSLLVTVLGEFVYPRDTAVWTTTLISALGALGVEEKAARQAISRVSQEGLLESTRSGRRVQWSLTGPGAKLLRAGTDRIYGFLRGEREWDGRWLLLSVPVPEAQRQLRHRLRTQLTWLGMGSPAPGLWVVPDAGKVRDVDDVLDQLDLKKTAFAWTGTWAEVGDREELIAAAWSLDEVAEKYREFADTFSTQHAATPTDAFVAQVRLVQEWRRFPFIDPALPARLLDSNWPGPHAVRVFDEAHARWHEDAQAQWEAWVRDSDER